MFHERLAVLCKVCSRLAMMTTIMALQEFSGHTAVNTYLQQIIGNGGKLTTGANGPITVGVDGLHVAATVVLSRDSDARNCSSAADSSRCLTLLPQC